MEDVNEREKKGRDLEVGLVFIFEGRDGKNALRAEVPASACNHCHNSRGIYSKSMITIESVLTITIRK